MIDLPPTNDFPENSIVIVMDVSQPSTAERLLVYRMEGDKPVLIAKTKVAHGKGSDGNNDGVADTFSNTPNSLATSLGTYKIAEPYHGKYGLSYRLDGLEPSNSNARARAVVMHEAEYVSRDKVGRSWGCPAVARGFLRSVLTPLFSTASSAWLVVKRGRYP